MYYVTTMNLNILSCSIVDKYGITNILEKNRCCLLNCEKNHTVVGTINRSESDRLYKVKMMLPDRNENRAGRSKVNTKRSPTLRASGNDEKLRKSLWHTRISYVNDDVMKVMINGSKYGISVKDQHWNTTWDTYVRAKHTKLS